MPCVLRGSRLRPDPGEECKLGVPWLRACTTFNTELALLIAFSAVEGHIILPRATEDAIRAASLSPPPSLSMFFQELFGHVCDSMPAVLQWFIIICATGPACLASIRRYPRLLATPLTDKLWLCSLYALNLLTGYLLMLAVMTYNTGSVLTFI